MTTSSISYLHLSQKIIDYELPSKETLYTFSKDQQIEILILCYDVQKILLNKLLEEKRIEHANIEFPVVQLPKRNKNQSLKLKLWELCPWLPKDYFSNIKGNFILHLEANKITELTTYDNEPEIEQQLTSIFKKYTMMNKENIDLTFRPSKEFKEMNQEYLNSDNDDSESFGSNFYENCDGSTSNTYKTSSSSNYITPASNRHIISTSSNYETPASIGYIDPTSDSNNEM
ncbi:18219_t:CDS:2 [Gigaspora margarita]|uniref:18219_t:CDS:1 n=1 Tax=Gigaspora margarita TaxID=4874 RepID=A0ABN7VQL0_GIGMA|nr:18219_t:CDS:2 [Gigaspora margarita]